MKVLCSICARGGSKGVKNKNIRKLCGKPLIAHTIIQAKKTNLFDKVIVSSDAPSILKVAETWGADLIIKRPDDLATDQAPKLPVIIHAVETSESFYKTNYDFIVDLDVTSPLRSVADIVDAFDLLKSSNAPNLITAAPARRSPYFNMIERCADGSVSLVKELNQAIVRRQDAPHCYDMNASIYIWRRNALGNGKLINPQTLLYVMPEERSFDIDSMLDWKIVQYLARQRQELI